MKRKKITIFRTFNVLLSFLLVFSTFGSTTPLLADSADQPASVIEWDEELQEIDGFGGSFAFHKGGSIMRLDDPVRTQILDLLFSQEKGIGISIVRNMVGDGGIDDWGNEDYDGPSETIMPNPGEYVWDDPDWNKDEFDKYQIWIMNEAKKRGVETFLSTVWSPPAWMKQNNSVIDNGEGPNKLREDMYQQFAEYLADYVKGYKEHFDIDITHVSPANEPDLNTGYSSNVWTPDELNTFVRDYMGPTFEDRDIGTNIVLGEAMRFSEEYALPAINDPKTNKYVDVVAAHAYTGLQEGETTPDPDAFKRSNELGKTIWQTEYMNQGDNKQTFENNTITDGLRYANLIGNMFEVSGTNAYFWWWPAANNGADGSDLIRLVNDGSDQGIDPTENGLYRVFKRFYTFGNYSRFIQPGYVMLEANNPADDVKVTAYKDSATDNFTIVAVNNSVEDQTITFDLDNFPEDVNAVVPYRTSASENLKKLDSVNVNDNNFTMELRGSSVTSFIPEQFELPALPDMKDVFSTYLAAENDGQTSGLRVDNNKNGDKVITNVRDGSYIKYSNVNFADGSASGEADKRGILSMKAKVAPIAGGTIEVRLDDPYNGKIVGTMDVPRNGNPNDPITVSTMIDTNSTDGAYGFHDLYLVFTTENNSNRKMFNVSKFEFSDEVISPIEE
ncbi:glycoside hydrolase [Oceanobacillus halophilus]|uniref:Carbohydrate-binding protein n=1 Tax=Oceanobacillus halophilus TaxID=930130 RepID=A0A495A097_9BACI|nr:glycoside hydrolase [Oceanobacillus halophilus]RKQ32485.1 carbohydrate-binding protein [Oceanobacillus halophilus]